MNKEEIEKIKEKIIEILKNKGPSLLVPISIEIKTNTIFSSALLSELLSENKIKMSYMRVGSSPIYYLNDQESQLEKFSEYLKSKEKEAFNLLKEKKILKDSEQEPAIRVALKEIKDFAKPIEKDNELFWVYFKENLIESKENLIEKKEREISTEEKGTKRVKKRKKEVPYLEKITEFLNKKNVQNWKVLNSNKKQIIVKIKENDKEKLIIFYNKKTISEKDMINAYKKSIEFNLPYILLIKGNPSKKMTNIIKAIRNLDLLERIE